MGGLQNFRCEKRGVVEDCLILSVKDVCTGGGCHNGLHRWRCGDHDLGAIKHEINLRSAEQGCLWLWYNVAGVANCVAISMISTVLHTGGRRWWFICPVTGKRVGKLYLPAGATHFVGRQAHDLTYTSCQKSGRDKRFWRKIPTRSWPLKLALSFQQLRTVSHSHQSDRGILNSRGALPLSEGEVLCIYREVKIISYYPGCTG